MRWGDSTSAPLDVDGAERVLFDDGPILRHDRHARGPSTAGPFDVTGPHSDLSAALAHAGIPLHALLALVGGDGALATIRLDRGVAFFVADHLARLEGTLQALALPALSDSQRTSLVARLQEIAREVASSAVPWRARVAIWPAEGALHRVVHATAEPAASEPAPLRLVEVFDPGSQRGRAGKTLSWGPLAALRRAARSTGADDALLVDVDGPVEGTFGALAWSHAGHHEVWVRANDPRALHSVTATALVRAELAEPRPVVDLVHADALVLLSSVRLATPVAEVRTREGQVLRFPGSDALARDLRARIAALALALAQDAE